MRDAIIAVDLKTFIEVHGRVTGAMIFDYFGVEFSAEELRALIEDREVSSHTDKMGTRFYRYPYYVTKYEAEKNKTEEGQIDKEAEVYRPVLDLIREKPGLSGEAIRKELGYSKDLWNRLSEKALASGLVKREKEGVAYRYYRSNQVPEKAMPLDKQLVIYLEEHKFKTPVELYEHFKPKDEDAFFALIDELVESKRVTVDDDGTLFVH